LKKKFAGVLGLTIVLLVSQTPPTVLAQENPSSMDSDPFYSKVRDENRKIGAIIHQTANLQGLAMGWKPLPPAGWSAYCQQVRKGKSVVGEVPGFADTGKLLEENFQKKYRDFPYDQYDRNHLPGTKTLYLKRINRFQAEYDYMGAATKKLLRGGCRRISDLPTQRQYLMASSQYFQIVGEALHDIESWRASDISRQESFLRHKKFEDQLKAAKKKSFFGF